MRFYKLKIAEIKQELKEGRLTAKGAAIYAAKILGWKGQAVAIEAIQKITGLPKSSLYRALETLEKEGQIIRGREKIWIVPETGLEFPETGLEFPETGLEFPKMKLKFPKTQSERGKRENLDITDTGRSNTDNDDDEHQQKQKNCQEGNHQHQEKTKEKIKAHSVKDQSSAAAAASDREKSEASDPPARPATAAEDELLNWIITQKLPLLPQKPVIPRAVARSLAKHAEIAREFEEWKRRTAPPPPPPPRPKTEEEIQEQRKAIVRGLIEGGLADLAKKKMREWRLKEEEIWAEASEEW